MKYYSEEEILLTFPYWSNLTKEVTKEIVDHMTGIETFAEKDQRNPDRERIRMELWKDLYMKRPVYVTINEALEAFDKQFPNS